MPIEGKILRARAGEDNIVSKYGMFFDDNNSSGSWVWGRWILFVLFVLGILIVLISTARLNKRRTSQGRAPVRGTAWFTPPSYIQSQHQYNRTNRPAEDYVPEYTAETNENDLGYYDERGEFHSNINAKHVAPPSLKESFRESSHSRIPSVSPSGPQSIVETVGTFTRPTFIEPPAHTRVNNTDDLGVDSDVINSRENSSSNPTQMESAILEKGK